MSLWVPKSSLQARECQGVTAASATDEVEVTCLCREHPLLWAGSPQAVLCPHAGLVLPTCGTRSKRGVLVGTPAPGVLGHELGEETAGTGQRYLILLLELLPLVD